MNLFVVLGAQAVDDWPFYTACCCFDVLSIGSVLCLLIASFGNWVSQCHNSIVKTDNHSIHRGKTRQILALWRRPVASRVALDLPCWAMHTVSHQHIAMVTEMTSEGGVNFCLRQFIVVHNPVQGACWGTEELGWNERSHRRNYETWDNNQMDLKIMNFNLNVKWKRNGFNCRFQGMCNA